MISKDKKNALERAIKDIEKQFGKGSVMLMGEKENRKNIEVISTGSLEIGRASCRERV